MTLQTRALDALAAAAAAAPLLVALAAYTAARLLDRLAHALLACAEHAIGWRLP